jgi:hypothetical protein
MKTKTKPKKTAKKSTVPVAVKNSMEDFDFEAKSGAESFGYVAHSVPIPTHLLSSKISKNDNYMISRMVAMRVNEALGKAARTVQYVANTPKNNANRKRIVANTRSAIGQGDKAKTKLKTLFKQSNQTGLPIVMELDL